MDEYGWYEQSCLSPDSDATVYEGGDGKDSDREKAALDAANRRYLPQGMKLKDYPYKYMRETKVEGKTVKVPVYHLEEDPYGDDDEDPKAYPHSKAEEGKLLYNKWGVNQRTASRYLIKDKIFREGMGEDAAYYRYKPICDKGFNKWVQANDKTYDYMKWIGMLNFKFYRMTYSNFFGRKQFTCIYSKKKYKKHIIMSTMISMFLSELLMIVCDVVGITSLPFGEQMLYTLVDTAMLTLTMMFLQFYEISKLDKPNTYMITVNTSGHQGKKSLAANESSDEEGLVSTSSEESDQDDWPDWRLMLKHVEGNTELFKKTQFQLKLNELEIKMDLRKAESLVDFDTKGEADQRDGKRADGAPRIADKNPAYWDDDDNFDYVEDPRGTQSYPASPTFQKEFDGPDFEHYGNRVDNCYAESQAPRVRGDGKEYSEMGTQAQPSEILTALARKGGDLITPKDNDNYHKKRSQKKKRGRKNKYYRQIDAEDDEEADQMSEGSEEDGLDGIKEEDEEDEEERLAKLAALQKQRELEEQARLKAEEEARKKKEATEKAAAEKKARAEAEAKWMSNLREQVAVDDLARLANKGDKNGMKQLEAKKNELHKRAQDGDEHAARMLKELEDEKEQQWRASYGDPDAIRKLKELENLRDLRKKALLGDQSAIDKLKKLQTDQKRKAGRGDKKAAEALKDTEARLKKLAANGDPVAIQKLKDLQLQEELVKRAANGDQDAIK